MSIKGKLRRFWKHLKGHTDPVESCLVYKERGCVHVDGLLCNFPNCSLFKKYYKKKINGELWGSCADCKNQASCSSPLFGEGCDTHYEKDEDYNLKK